MISIGRSLIEYPLFRLTIFMAAGIFFSDTCLTHVAPLIVWVTVWSFSVLFTLLLSFLRSRYRSVAFGLSLSLCAFLFGITLVQLHHRRIVYNWPAQPQLYQAVVLSSPQPKPRTFALRVNVHTSYTPGPNPGNSSSVIDREVLLYLPADSLAASLRRGDSLHFSSVVSPVRPDSCSSGYLRYLYHQGISGTSFVRQGQWQYFQRSTPPDLIARALSAREALLLRFRRGGITGDPLAVLSALTIGDKTLLTPQLRSVYTAAGASHILALSGMHVGIIALILLYFLYPLTLLPHGGVLRSLLAVAALWIFAFIAGWGPSVVRAVSMFTLYTLATLVTDEQYRSVHALTLTAFLMLVVRPFHLFDVGFQLSFAAVFSILLFYPVFSRVLQLRNPLIRYVWNVMCLSVAAQLGTFPLVLYHFGAFPTYFLYSNLVVSPLAFVILFLAILVLAIGSCPLVGPFLTHLLNAQLTLLNTSMTWLQHLYGAQLTSLTLSGVQLFLLCIIIFSIRICLDRPSPRQIQFILVSFVLFLVSTLY